MQTRLHIIVAADRYGNIGVNNSIPWKLEGDLKRFKQVTMTHTVVIGRKTYESFGRALDGRTVIVVTSKADTNPDVIERLVPGLYGDEIYLAPSLTEAIGCARRLGTYMDETPETIHIYVAGGAQLYKDAWDIADFLDFTLVMNRRNVSYDTSIPDFNVNDWELEYPAEKVEGMLEGHVTETISHVQYRARRVKPGTKKLHIHPRNLEWVFDHMVGHKDIDNDIAVARDAHEDNEIDQVVRGTFQRPVLAQTSGEPAGTLAYHQSNSDWMRHHGNPVSADPAQQLDPIEARALAVLSNAIHELKTPGKVTSLPTFISQVRHELELCMLPVMDGHDTDDQLLNKDGADLTTLIAAARDRHDAKLPAWTVLYNTTDDNPVGKVIRWEFFKEEAAASACYSKQEAAGTFPTKRPYHHGRDYDAFVIGGSIVA